MRDDRPTDVSAPPNAFHLARVFLRRDLREELTYPWVVAMEFASVAGSLVVLFFVSVLVDGGDNRALAPYGGSYLPFAVLGIVAMDFLWVSLRGFNQRIRQHQLTGTLEVCLMTRTPLWGLILFSPTYSLVKASLRAVIYLGGAFLLATSSVRPSGILPALGGMLLALVVFMSIGVISASITLVIKRGDPLAYLVNAGSLLVGGVLYPVEVLPSWLQAVSWLLPVTPALEILRVSLLGDGTLTGLGPALTALGIYAAVSVPAAIVMFRWADGRVRRDGTVADY